MAVKTYRLGSGADGNFGALFEADQTAASRTDGWTVGKIAAANSAEFDVGVKQATGAFSLQSATAKPASLLTGATANAFKTPAALSGVFAATAWTFTFAARAGTASAQAGRARMRVYRSVNADGSGATEITSATQVGTTSAALTTTADGTTTVTWSPGTTVTLNGEYLFFVLAWEITTASGSNSGDVLLRTGQAAAGSRLVTPDFVAAQTVPVGRRAAATVARGITITAAPNVVAVGRIGLVYAAEVLADAPAAYWRMEEAGLPQDSSGTGKHLDSDVRTVPQAAGLLAADPALKARGFVAAGGGSFVSLGGLYFPFNVFSVEAWVKRTRSGVQECLIDQYNGGLGVWIRPDGTLSLIKSFTAACATTSVLKITDTNTHHIVVTRNGIGGAVVFYLDGVAETPTLENPNLDFAAASTTGIFVGSQWGTDPLDGTLDEVAVYPSVLSPARVAARVAAGANTGTAVVRGITVARQFAPYARAVISDGASAYFKMSEASGSLTDEKSAIQAGLSGAGGVAYGVAGVCLTEPDTAIKFLGSTYFSRAGGAGVDLGDVFTLEAWVARNSLTGGISSIIERGAGCYQIRLNPSGQIELLKSNTALIATSTVAITDLSGHHVVGTKNGSAVKLYLDGVDVTGAVANATCDASNAYPFLIGSNWNGTEIANLVIDEVAVYPTALTATQVADHYQKGVAVPPSLLPVGRRVAVTAVSGVTLAPTGAALLLVGKRSAATTARGVTLAPGVAAITVGKRAAATSVLGVTLAPGPVVLPVGKRVAATTVRGATVAPTGSVALAVGRRAAATVTRGVTVVGAAASVPVGFVVSATITRGVALAPGAVPLPVGKRVAASAVRGVTLAATGSVALAVGARTAATSVRGATLAGTGLAPLVLGRRVAATTTRGVTLAAAGAAPLAVGQRVAATTVRGATFVATGTVLLAVGAKAAATSVKGVALVAQGALVPVGRVSASTTTRGITLVPGVVAVPIGRRAAVTAVGGVTAAGAGAAPLTVGRRAAVTVVRGLTLVAAGVPLAVGRRVAATTVRGATLAGTGTAAAVAVGRRVTATVVQGATLAGTGSVPLAVGRRAATSTTRGVTLLGAGTAFLGVGKRSAATTVRGVTLAAQGAPLTVGSRGAATVVRGATLAAGGAAPLVVGKLTAATTVRGATLVGAGVAPLPVGRRAAATTVRGATLTGAGTAAFTVGRRGASTVVRGVTIFQAVGTSWAVSYQLTANVGRSTVLPYNVATRVARSLVVPYLIRQSAARSWVISYELTQAGVRGKSWALRYLVHLDTSGSAVVDPTANTVWIQAPEDTLLDPSPNTSGIEAMLRSVLDPSGVSTPPPVEQGVRLCGEGLCGEGTCGGWGGGDDAVRAGRTDDQLFAAGGLPS